MSNTNQISQILNVIKEKKEKYDQLAALNGENFNIFSVIELETDEVRTHSKLIAELLDPNGSHSQGSLFLQLFFEQLDIDFQESKLEKFEVKTEKYIKEDDSRIDIFLHNPTTEKCIVIENKIYAGDQARQLERYTEHATSKSKKAELVEVLYLTLEGEEPGDYTLGELSIEDVRCISYKHDIIQWLEHCLQEVPRIPQIREILYHYQQLIHQLTGQPMNNQFITEAIEIFYEKENFKVLEDLEDTIQAFKIDVQYNFWESLRESLDSNEIVSDLNEVKREKVKNYYTGGQDKYPHLLFKVGETKRYRVMCTIELEFRIYFGFQLINEDGETINVQRDDSFTEYIQLAEKALGKRVKQDSNWLGWTYPQNKGKTIWLDFYNFGDHENNRIKELLSQEERNKIISDLTADITDKAQCFQKKIK